MSVKIQPAGQKTPATTGEYFFSFECPDNVASEVKFDPNRVPFRALLSRWDGRFPHWVVDEHIDLIEDIERHLNSFVASSRSSKTLLQYQRQYKKMRFLGQRPEDIHSTIKSYYTKRAAYIWGQSHEASYILEVLANALTEDDEDLWTEGIKALRCSLSEFERYPYYAEGHDTFSGVCHFYLHNGQKKHHESKRKNSKNLPLSWRSDVWDALSDRTKNKAAVALLMTVAPRPAELEAGVTVIADDRAILVGIEGAKFVEGKRGQKMRGIRVDALSPEAQYLLNLAKRKDGQIEVKATSVSGLNKLLVRTGRHVLGKKVTLSAYDYRHALASDLKAEGRSQEEIAIVLGHQSSRTQTGYGQSQQSRGSRNPIVAVKGSESVRVYRRSFDFASVPQSDPTTFSNC
ncbi:hypothetical protein V5T82_09515 [Magnetovibrio sp. PR-2]|uniref:hypothetical protein n=1 Tax=Magnetovibrio sp. PR-2 TaxID=3120356 RepID=UPI002FCE66CC